MKSFDVAKDAQGAEAGAMTTLRAYVPPSIRVMDEKDVLSAFQVTVAAISWWMM
jgi:hypothetical protein